MVQPESEISSKVSVFTDVFYYRSHTLDATLTGQRRTSTHGKRQRGKSTRSKSARHIPLFYRTPPNRPFLPLILPGDRFFSLTPPVSINIPFTSSVYVFEALFF